MLKLLDKDIFDDTISFIVKDDWHSAAIIGLDLRKLRLSNWQKCTIAKELRKTPRLFDPPPKNDISETLCLVVEIEDYSFTFQGLDVNTLEPKLLYISGDFYNHGKVKEYIQAMTDSYNLAYKNIKNKTDLIKELSELTDSIV